MALYVHEFIYRGRAPGSAESPAWHLVLASDVKDEQGRDVRPELALTMVQAQAKGWGLPEIFAAINAGLVAEAGTLRAEPAGRDTEAAGPEAERDVPKVRTGRLVDM